MSDKTYPDVGTGFSQADVARAKMIVYAAEYRAKEAECAMYATSLEYAITHYSDAQVLEVVARTQPEPAAPKSTLS